MRILALIGLLAIVLAVAGTVYFFGGFFNVAASQPDPDIVKWALQKVRMASVSRHAIVNSPVDLENPDVIHAGARAFLARGCANCHGAPGVNWQKFAEGIQPDPPDLKDVVNEREPRELFWVVKNGINMTAMPSFGAIGAEDSEIWSIVAFLRKLPSVSEADFKEWTATP
jgi:mono/diheme cytochrome c family protein